jgi:hypothetical protein
VHRYGPLYIAAFLFDLVRIRLSEQVEGFDARFGTDTATIVFPWNLPSIAHEYKSEVHAYQAAPAWLIREILDSIPLQPNTFAFIDLGSGKGRALLVASELPFAKIVGVELSHELHRIAEQNLGRYRSASQHCMNAIEYTLGQSRLCCFCATLLGGKPFGEYLPAWRPH